MSTTEPQVTHDFEALLDFLKRTRGFDITGYKRSSPMRRISRRMHEVGVQSFRDYQDYLEVHPDEFARLFNTVLINVTSFFRDPEAWEALAGRLLPKLLAAKAAGEPIRVWSAACSTGEEAYTLAMLLAEAVGLDLFRERVKLYGTDIDEEALAHARNGSYTARQVEGVPAPLLERYFERAESRYLVRKELRRNVIFGRNDLTHDSPISRIDVLTCRNSLMYFNSEMQARILARLHFALNDGGVLMLGRSETLATHAGTFVPLDLKQRIFGRVPRGRVRERLLLSVQGGGVLDTISPPQFGAGGNALREASFEANPVAAIVLDDRDALVLANQCARTSFGIAQRDLGRPLQDLEVSYCPVELRSLIDEARVQRRVVHRKDLAWPLPGGALRTLDVQVTPLFADGGRELLGTTVTLNDVTLFKNLQAELQQANQELETAYEELQATVEELETTNEELQSTAEELETMNEELQTTNEEVEAVNSRLRRDGALLNRANLFLEAIVNGFRGGIAVLDGEGRVQLWNRAAEELWSVRADEAQNLPFLSLDIGLPLDQLRASIRGCLAGEKEADTLVLNATDRRGRPIRCQVTCTPLRGAESQVEGLVMVMEPKQEGADQ